MTDTEKTALEKFLLDIDCLNDLSQWIDKVNIFEILKLTNNEIRHSNFLAWLLNPNESHSFGDKILKDVICHIIKNNFNIDNGFNIIDIMLWDYESFNVYREKDNMDILIVSDKLDVEAVICIENKIFAEERDKQTKDYRKKVNELYPSYKKMFIFLTPDGYEAVDHEYWVTLSYGDIIKIIEKNLALKINNVNTNEKIFIENYISGVKTHIMKDEKLQEICSKIYFTHKSALDLIFENKPDIRYWVFEALIKKLEEAVENKKDIILDKNASKGKMVKFNTSNSIKWFPKLNESQKSYWDTDYVFYYSINIRDGKSGNFAIVIDSNNIWKNKLDLFEKMVDIIEKNRAGKSPEWWSVILSKVTKENFDGMSDEGFYENKENIIAKIVDEIYEKVMKTVEDFENSIKANADKIRAKFPDFEL